MNRSGESPADPAQKTRMTRARTSGSPGRSVAVLLAAGVLLTACTSNGEQTAGSAAAG